MAITKDSSPNHTSRPDFGNHGSARGAPLKPAYLDSSDPPRGEDKDLLDSIIQKNLRDFLAGQTAANAAKTASAQSGMEALLPANDAKVTEKDLTVARDANPNNILTSTRIGTFTDDTDCDQVIWETDSSRSVKDEDGDIVLEDAPDHLHARQPTSGGGPTDTAMGNHNDEDFRKPQSKENACPLQIGTIDNDDSAEEGEIAPLKRAFSRNGNTIPGNVTDSPAHLDRYRPSYYRAYATSPSAPDTVQRRNFRRPASVCRLNIPRELLANLHRDPRFDQYCHAWINRPDFCGRGDECYYAHMYPPGTVEEFGILTLDIDANGSVFSGQDGGAEQRESRWSRYLLPGRQEYTPGCYDRICKDFERGLCRRGPECWYQHSTDPAAIRRRQGVFWKSRVDSKLEALANTNRFFMKPSLRSNYSGQNRAFIKPNYYGSSLGRTRTGLSRSQGINPSYTRQDYSRAVSPSIRDWEEASIASWNAIADRNAREYAGQQERLMYLHRESQRRRTGAASTRPTASAAGPIKIQGVKSKQSLSGKNEEGSGDFSEENPLVMGDRSGSVDVQTSGKANEGILISFLC
ncbi:unnamed protein product [Tuber aestivum]|uniref:C3H1-type domain-containing protein n=1 Tax=Tuber aestivum TaxID=59557 RepID=A0A292PPD8_9PEZI|nr:unnamed protein product [Tuber aestivum]